MKESIRLINMEDFHIITKETDGRFLFEYQRAVLLALKDNRILTEAQYRLTEEKLRKQFAAFM